jgi:3-methylfumaryl-CoA hydratase
MSGDFSSWLRRQPRLSVAVLDPWPVAALTAALGREDPPGRGAPLPPFWHQLYHLEAVPAAATAEDGHGVGDLFLPRPPGMRRMWAGGRLTIERPLRLGQEIEKVSVVKSVTPKEGATGPLVFVQVEHRLSGPEGLAVIEEQDIVYREAGGARKQPAGLRPARAAGSWQHAWVPDPVLLFRFSALTFNGHRIHYDRAYATEVEGYPGLVVHGPLLATLLLELLRRAQPRLDLQGFSYRAQAPLFADRRLVAHGAMTDQGQIELWVEGEGGVIAMTASAR